MDEITHGVFRMPGMFPLFLAAAAPKVADLKETLKEFSEDETIPEEFVERK